MLFDLLHLNIEGDKHIDKVKNLISAKKPDVICLAEAFYEDVRSMSSELGYELAFSQLLTLKSGEEVDRQGSAILSNLPMQETKIFYYNDSGSENPKAYTLEETSNHEGIRPENRFEFSYSLLTARLNLTPETSMIVSTTHFPVVDHQSPDLKDHVLHGMQNVIDEERAEAHADRLKEILGGLPHPLIFTADLNNPRGESIYGSLAHLLADRVPPDLKSSLDPNLHRAKNVELMVDTIMTSQDVSVRDFKVIEGVSDHKAFLASVEIN